MAGGRRVVAAGLVALGCVVVTAAPLAGASTTARAACDYSHPDDCLPGGGGGGGTVETPMFDPSLIGLAATAVGGGTAGLLVRRRSRSPR